MAEQIRALGIAPYEGMKPLMTEIAADYPQMDLTVFVGDMEAGLAIARRNLHGNYDIIISRGETARILKHNLPLPLVEIEISLYDILCTLQLAGQSQGKTALVSLADIAANAELLSSLIGYHIDIFSLSSPGEVEPTLLRLREEQYRTILCDVIADTTAKKLGMNSFLITSGANSIRNAYENALLLCRNQERLREENQLFRRLLQGQIGQTVVFDQQGDLHLTSQENPNPEVLEMLRRELPESRAEAERRVVRTIAGTMYTIRSQRIGTYTAFFFDARKTPLSPNQVGIRFFSRSEAERDYYNSIFGFASALIHPQEEIEKVLQTSAPVMISGEDGTGKEYVAFLLYIRGPLRHNPFISINCSLLNDKSWDFLLSHHNSPLTDLDNTLFFASVDALPDERCRQLLASLSEMDVCLRNRVLFSCISQPRERISPVGSMFMDALGCVNLYLSPVRQLAEQINTLVNLYLSHRNADLPKQVIGLEPDAMELLRHYDWPHNYTQFQRVINDLASHAASPMITTEEVLRILQKEQHFGTFAPQGEDFAAPLDLNRTLEEINRDIALRVLDDADGNRTAAARRLGISRTTLWRLLQN